MLAELQHLAERGCWRPRAACRSPRPPASIGTIASWRPRAAMATCSPTALADRLQAAGLYARAAELLA